MKNPELYHKTVNILVQAYFNDMIRHQDCAACAVGNLVSANTGIGVYGTVDAHADDYRSWGVVFCTSRKHQSMNEREYFGLPKFQIDATGYTWQELAKVEYAFETAPKGNNDDEWMFNGLMAVIGALDIIHENTDAEVTTTSKSRFNKQLA